MNSKDPLMNGGNSSEAGRELFNQLRQVCNGFSADDVAVAAINLLVNCVRQNRAWRSDAQKLYDELTTKGRSVLLDQHYNPSGRRREVYPFHQVIEAGPVKNLNKIRGT